jgi:hypothetical protein
VEIGTRNISYITIKESFQLDLKIILRSIKFRNNFRLKRGKQLENRIKTHSEKKETEEKLNDS